MQIKYTKNDLKQLIIKDLHDKGMTTVDNVNIKFNRNTVEADTNVQDEPKNLEEAVKIIRDIHTNEPGEIEEEKDSPFSKDIPFIDEVR